jgi:RNA polymerase sigma-70 factor, ECF subfamily
VTARHGGTADRLIFDREIASFRPALYRGALQMTGNPSDAEDLVQETMARAYTGLQTFTPGTNAHAWLRRIMANTFVSACRKRRREVAQVLRPELDAPPASDSGSLSVEEEVLGQLALSEIGKAVKELPECYRAVVYLADAEDYRLAEIADLTGVPIGTVMSRLYRGRARLRRRLTCGVRQRG